MPRFTKGSKEAIEWGKKMREARANNKSKKPNVTATIDETKPPPARRGRKKMTSMAKYRKKIGKEKDHLLRSLVSIQQKIKDNKRMLDGKPNKAYDIENRELKKIEKDLVDRVNALMLGIPQTIQGAGFADDIQLEDLEEYKETLQFDLKQKAKSKAEKLFHDLLRVEVKVIDERIAKLKSANTTPPASPKKEPKNELSPVKKGSGVSSKKEDGDLLKSLVEAYANLQEDMNFVLSHLNKKK